MTFKVQDALDRFVDARHEERDPDGHLHPSGLFGCIRQAVYAFRGVPTTNPRTFSSKRTLYIGHLVHEQVQKAISESPDVVTFFDEVAIFDSELNVIGHADGLAWLIDGTVVLIEIKTIKGMSLRYKTLPQDDHIGQVLSYMRALREQGAPKIGVAPLGDKLTKSLIVYVIKDDWTTQEFEIEWSDEANKIVVGKVDEIWPYTLDEKSLPPRLPLVTKKGKVVRPWNCDYCPWADRCWNADPEEVKPTDIW
jgi:hypothetical protein